MKQNKIHNILVFTFPHLGHVNPSIPLVKELCEDCDNKVFLAVSKKYEVYYQNLPCEIIYYSDDIEKFAIQNSDQEVSDMIDDTDTMMRCFEEYFLQYEKIVVRNQILQDGAQWDAVFSDTYAVWGKIYAILHKCRFIGIECFFYESGTVKEKIIRDYLMELKGFHPLMVNEKLESTKKSLHYVSRKIQRQFGFSKENAKAYFDTGITIVMIEKNLQPYKEECKSNVYFWENEIELSLPESINDNCKKKKILITLGRERGEKHISKIKHFVDVFKELPEYDFIITTLEWDKFVNCKYKNIHIYEKIEQQQILKEAALLITHGGITGVKEAINLRVPMVFVPSTIQQLAVAKTVEKAGFGRVVTSEFLSLNEWKDIIQKLLSTEFRLSYEEALKLNSEIRGFNVNDLCK